VLVLGQWSLIDHQDSDGKRFLLARRNAPEVEELTALKEDEHRAAALFALLASSSSPTSSGSLNPPFPNN
jgi:hypothetical protein